MLSLNCFSHQAPLSFILGPNTPRQVPRVLSQISRDAISTKSEASARVGSFWGMSTVPSRSVLFGTQASEVEFESNDIEGSESELEPKDPSFCDLLKKCMSNTLTEEERSVALQKALQGLQLGVGEVQKALPGVGVGAPLATMATFFTGLHYGENIIGPKDVYLQFLIGYFTYGFDRLRDAIDAGDMAELSDSKKAFYQSILENKTQIIATLGASFALAMQELASTPETLPFIPVLLSTLAYKELKENMGALKPFYIAATWTLASVVLPSVMHDHDYSILMSPQDLLPMALLIFGSTNLADVKDYQEDLEKGVKTLPVQFGQWPTAAFSVASVLGAIAMVVAKMQQ